MMNDKLFDDFIREKMSNQVAAVPAGIWENILLEKKKEKEKLFWWKSLTVLFIVGLSVVLYTQNISEQNKNNVQRNPADATTSITGNTTTASNNNLQKEPQQNITHIPQNAQQNSAATEKTNSVQNQISVADKAVNNDKPNLTKSALADNHIALRGNTKNNNKNATAKQSPILAIQNSGIASLVADKDLEVASATPLRPFYDRYQILLFNEKDKRFNAFHEATQMMIAPSLFSSVDCPGDSRRGNHGLYAEFYFSPDIALKQMEYKRNASGVTPKDSNTTRQFSFSAGFRLAKEIGPNMVLRTGLQFSQINERFDYRNENERTTSMVITIRTITNSNGTTTTVRDTSIVEQIGYRVKTSYNYYKTWDVPLLLGYEYAGEGWKANINAGPVFNLSSRQSGDFLDSGYRPASFAKKGPAMFRNKLGISMYGSISLIKELSNVSSLFAEPYLRYSLSDRTTGTSPFTQRFHTAGILMGVRFKLN